MVIAKGYKADFLNGGEEDGDPVPKPASKQSIVIGVRIKEKNLWKRIRDFLRKK